jgi:membrane protein implicated in regulation of membrane protease activity
MMALHGWEWALLAAVVLAIIEVLTGAYVALSLAFGCLAVAAAEYVANEPALLRDAAVFALTAGLAVFVLRQAFARPGDSKAAQGDVNDY